jgi:hypothetical protein
LQVTARKNQVDPYLFRFLLLFAESEPAGLVDKFATAVDGREVTIRLTVSGRAAVTRCLDVLRSDAALVLGSGADDLTRLLGPPPALRRTSENAGWRAGVRAGMRAGE